MPQVKKGRPTDNPKKERLTIRLDNECIEIIDEFSKQENITKNDAVRKGIRKLKDDIKK